MKTESLETKLSKEELQESLDYNSKKMVEYWFAGGVTAGVAGAHLSTLLIGAQVVFSATVFSALLVPAVYVIRKYFKYAFKTYKLNEQLKQYNEADNNE